MTKSNQKAYRMTDETLKQIDYLARLWGPVVPLSGAEVFTECVRRVYEDEKGRKPRKEKAK